MVKQNKTGAQTRRKPDKSKSDPSIIDNNKSTTLPAGERELNFSNIVNQADLDRVHNIITDARQFYLNNQQATGRKPKLTPELSTMLYKLLLLGLPVNRALDMVGISNKTYYIWLEKAERGKGLYVQFGNLIKQAESELQTRILSNISVKAAKRDSWESDYRFLESRFKQDYSKQPDNDADRQASIKTITILSEALARPITVNTQVNVLNQGKEEATRLEATRSIKEANTIKE
jgi:transposase